MIENVTILHAQAPGDGQIIEGALSRKVTPNSFVVRTLDNALRPAHPQGPSVAAGCELLMSPLGECDFEIKPGAIIIAQLQLRSSATLYHLTRFTPADNEALPSGDAGSAPYQDAGCDAGMSELGELKSVRVYAVCRGVVEKVFG